MSKERKYYVIVSPRTGYTTCSDNLKNYVFNDVWKDAKYYELEITKLKEVFPKFIIE